MSLTDLEEFIANADTAALETLLARNPELAKAKTITITKDAGTLLAQATGQSAFPLDASKTTDTFEFESARIIMEFRPDKGEFTLK
ncbi:MULTISPECIES: hypothetical protein [unclassified Mucilaginibacter]|uniref:hypothetical protein n=1 Tax=unclassified Mucilaginibacter TaxID=2617802 RepID=UPI002AC8DE3E|nr:MULTISPECIES: hypothetical protein [unclassified Mucilaginibacter]MEB0262180.1 hypothetical protein [Mucilaginibacter sp. 10I4]MEB0277040.1 hypothetical protein [Mucilaginibacter sp. 10B2]MEB0302647.1 hypothetical protein [Mucilaginibacter sp. 5C4]WPX25141.1 hypothetical protein RHM67_07660 [Mucilaginibacter sp. 5C4]